MLVVAYLNGHRDGYPPVFNGGAEMMAHTMYRELVHSAVATTRRGRHGHEVGAVIRFKGGSMEKKVAPYRKRYGDLFTPNSDGRSATSLYPREKRTPG